MCKTIKQKVKFKASPEIIYHLLADSKKQELITGKKAMINNQIGGNFSIFDGNISGINVDLLENKRIVWAWRNKDFPEGIFSMAAFVFTLTNDGGTELILTHRGVPKNLLGNIEKFWKENYWERIKKYDSNKK